MESADPELSSPPLGRFKLLFILVFLAAIAAFGPALAGRFLLDWDDGLMVANNPMLAPDSDVSIARAWQAPYAGLYVPLTYTAYAAIAAAGRLIGRPMDPMLFHAFAVAFHLLGGVLLFDWLRRLVGRPDAALLGAAFWLLHPLQVEPVAWIGGMNSVLGGVLAIACLAASAHAADGSAGRRTGWYALAGLAFALSLAAKPSNVGLPVAFLLVQGFVLKRPWKEVLLWTGMLCLLAVPFVYQGVGAQTGGILEGDVAPLKRAMIAGHAVGFYLVKTVWPIGLATEYGLSPTVVLAERLWLVPAAVALFALVVALLQFRRRPVIAIGLGVMLAALSPVLGIVPFYYQSYSIVADRYAYVAIAGAALILAWLTRGLPDRALRTAVILLTVVFGCLTARQVTFWHDQKRVWTRAGQINPDGLFYNFHAMDFARDTGDLDGEIRCLERILNRRPFDPAHRLRYADVLAKANRPKDAIAQYQFAGFRQPNNADIWVRMGRLYDSLGDAGSARRVYGIALSIDPANPDALAATAVHSAPPATPPVATQPAGR